jgi:glycosyltransferase involved in cell wall biosynthesis
MNPAGISVVIPSYNQGCYLRTAIESALRQSYRPVEVLVIDGASTDNSVEILRGYDREPGVRWISERDGGPADAVNKGLRMARHAIGAITSADDFFLPGAFDECMAVFVAHPEVSLVYGDYRKGEKTGTEVPVHTGHYSRGDLLCGLAAVPQGSAFFRMDVALRLGGWNEGIPFVPDTDLWFRIALTGQVIKMDRFWSGSYVHPEQRTHQKANVLRDYTRMIEQMPELRSAPRGLRRAARAGLCIARMRYGTYPSEWGLARDAWRALLLYPRCGLSPVLPKHRFIPGYFKIAAWVGNVKRRLGLKTSTDTP